MATTCRLLLLLPLPHHAASHSTTDLATLPVFISYRHPQKKQTTKGPSLKVRGFPIPSAAAQHAKQTCSTKRQQPIPLGNAAIPCNRVITAPPTLYKTPPPQKRLPTPFNKPPFWTTKQTTVSSPDASPSRKIAAPLSIPTVPLLASSRVSLRSKRPPPPLFPEKTDYFPKQNKPPPHPLMRLPLVYRLSPFSHHVG
jgi:hypothetical protein